MMNQRAELAFFFTRTAGKNQQRYSFGKRPGDRIHHIMTARAIGDANYANFTRRARIAVSGKAHSRLMGKGMDLEVVFAPEGEEQLEREVARDPEDMADANLAQIGDQEVAERHTPFHRFAPPY